MLAKSAIKPSTWNLWLTARGWNLLVEFLSHDWATSTWLFFHPWWSAVILSCLFLLHQLDVRLRRWASFLPYWTFCLPFRSPLLPCASLSLQASCQKHHSYLSCKWSLQLCCDCQPHPGWLCSSSQPLMPTFHLRSPSTVFSLKQWKWFKDALSIEKASNYLPLFKAFTSNSLDHQ